MNKELAIILREKLKDLPFVEVIGGMVQTITDSQPVSEESNSTITKRYPVSDNVLGVRACEGREIQLIPISEYKSILYFEDFGIVPNDKVRHGWTSTLRLVCWMNRAKIVGDEYAAISGIAIAKCVEKLDFVAPINEGIFTRLVVKPTRILPQDAGIFSRYTYEEPVRQYLRPPFEFFGIDLLCNYSVPPNCLPEVNWNLQKCY